MLLKKEVLSRLKPALAEKPYLPQNAATATPSAVLVIIHYHDGDTPYFFLTKRSSNLRSHGGDMSFPGGQYTKEDGTLLATALRETEEEIGIVFRPEQVIGSLKAVRTMTSNHFIVPFITLQNNLPEHKIARGEVEAVIDAPLLETLKSIKPDTEHYHLASDSIKFTYGCNVIWGATARILKQLYELLIVDK
jgi:8-oxo-dGTP pyrophosphatase MutT (NUDIX family)